MSRDPLGYVDGVNMYAYVGNNPLNFVDPMGTVKRGINAVSRFFGGSDVFNLPSEPSVVDSGSINYLEDSKSNNQLLASDGKGGLSLNKHREYLLKNVLNKKGLVIDSRNEMFFKRTSEFFEKARLGEFGEAMKKVVDEFDSSEHLVYIQPDMKSRDIALAVWGIRDMALNVYVDGKWINHKTDFRYFPKDLYNGKGHNMTIMLDMNLDGSVINDYIETSEMGFGSLSQARHKIKSLPKTKVPKWNFRSSSDMVNPYVNTNTILKESYYSFETVLAHESWHAHQGIKGLQPKVWKKVVLTREAIYEESQAIRLQNQVSNFYKQPLRLQYSNYPYIENFMESPFGAQTKFVPESKLSPTMKNRLNSLAEQHENEMDSLLEDFLD